MCFSGLLATIMKIISILFSFLLFLSPKQGAIHGEYNNCNGKNHGCSFLKLNKDGSFQYGTPSHGHMGREITNGNYKHRNDTIFLNNNLKWHTVKSLNPEKKNDSTQVIQIVSAYNNSKRNGCKNAKVFTNHNQEIEADAKGYLTIRKGFFDSLRIQYIGCHIKWIPLSKNELKQDSLIIQCNLENIGHPELNDFKFLIKKDSLLCLEHPYNSWHLKRK